MINHYSFYTAFHTPEELRVLHGSRSLGTIAVDPTLRIDGLLLLGGRRWRVVEIEFDKKIVMVMPASGARPPAFDSKGGPLVADEVRQRMRRLYLSADVPGWIDDEAAQLLSEGRAAFARLGLASSGVISCGKDTFVVPWRGDKILNTLAVVLQTHQVRAMKDDLALVVEEIGSASLQDLLGQIADGPTPEPVDLATGVPCLELDKHDHYLTHELLTHSYAARFLDVPNTWQTCHDLSNTRPATTNLTGRRTGLSAQIEHTPFSVVDV